MTQLPLLAPAFAIFINNNVAEGPHQPGLFAQPDPAREVQVGKEVLLQGTQPRGGPHLLQLLLLLAQGPEAGQRLLQRVLPAEQQEPPAAANQVQLEGEGQQVIIVPPQARSQNIDHHSEERPNVEIKELENTGRQGRAIN